MRRRALLASIASAGALAAGCLGDDGSPGGDPNSSPTDDPSTPTDDPSTPIRGPSTPTDGGSTPTDGDSTPTDGDSTPTDGDSSPTGTPTNADVTVDEFTLQRGVVVPTAPDAIGVDEPNRRYVWADVSVDGGTIPRADFAVATGNGAFAPVDVRTYRTAWNRGKRYESERGWLLFELPLQVEATRLALRWPGGEYEADDALARRLSQSPPSMAVDVRKQYADSPDRPIAIEVTNESDRPGRFVVAVNREGPRIAYAPIQAFSQLVAGGETRTLVVEDPMSHRTPSPGSDGPPDMTYHVQWAGGGTDVDFG